MLRFETIKCDEYRDTYLICLPKVSDERFDEIRDWLSTQDYITSIIGKYSNCGLMIYFYDIEFLTALSIKLG